MLNERERPDKDAQRALYEEYIRKEGGGLLCGISLGKRERERENFFFYLRFSQEARQRRRVERETRLAARTREVEDEKRCYLGWRGDQVSHKY